MSSMRRKIWNLIRGGSFHGYLRTSSGYPLTLTGCMAEYPVSLAIAGNTVQNGTPAADNPVEVQGVGDPTEDRYKLPVTVSGRNLFPAEVFKNIILANVESAQIKTVDGRECISVSSGYLNNITGTGVSELKYLFTHGIKENTQYTFTFSIKNISADSDFWIAIYHTDGTWRHSLKKNIPNGEWGTLIAISDVGKTVSGIGFTYGKGGIRLYDYSTAMLVEGTYSRDTMPAYEPYHEPQTIPIYMDSPLYSNDDVADTVKLDIVRKKAICTKRISVDDNGNVTQLAAPVTTDISDMQDWDSIPKLWRGTAIFTADTTIQPSDITVKYYADKPEEVS